MITFVTYIIYNTDQLIAYPYYVRYGMYITISLDFM